MAVGREIKTKIGSISNTQKITSAMEKVAASKMRRTQDLMEKGRPYSRNIMRVIGHVANASSEYKHEFMQERAEIKRVGYIVISTDRGLCGGLNLNLCRHLVRELREWNEKDVQVDLCLIGNKAADFFRSVGGNIVAATSHLGDEPSIADLIGSIKVMLDSYSEGNIDRIFLANNVFVNTMTQKPQVEQIVPLFPEEDENMRHHWDYIYEPEAQELLEGLLTRFIEAEVYQGVMENHACEQAAKMIAMKNATENAGDIIDELQLLYNNQRQAAITQEISEIVGGAAAV